MNKNWLLEGSRRFWRVIYCILSIEKCTDQDIARLLDFPEEEVKAYRSYMKSAFSGNHEDDDDDYD